MRRALAGLMPACAVTLLALTAAAAALLVAGESPFHLFKALLRGAFGTRADVARTLAGATPLIFTGLAVAIPFRAGLFNIGAEGQLVLAGFLAGAVAAWLPGLPAPLLLPLVAVLAIAVGSAWAAIAGVLRARLSVHEVIGTILLNFLALWLVRYLLRVPSFSLLSGMEPKTPDVPAAIRWPEAISGSGVGTGLLVAVALAVLTDLALFRTKPGLMLRATGGSPTAARAAGVPTGGVVVLALVAGGAFASLAGVQQVCEVHGAYLEGFSPGYGFTGIAVALLAANRPLGVVLAALFFAVLRSGAFVMDALAGIPRETVTLVEVLVILLVAAERFRGAL
ncbi:MAG: ABC transporter permease, partial [Planctomycetota bacterium]